MQRIVVSSVGTSLLTQQINRSASNESDWYVTLRDRANLKFDEIDDRAKKIILTLQKRAIQKLNSSNVQTIRAASAELNGIYGIYGGDLSQGTNDTHFLIATDTAQGETTAKIVESFLQQQGIANVSVYKPDGLSTASTTNFSEGIDELIVWLQNNIEPLKNSYKIIFNLVGSFKSLQGYLNTIGMFYADEIIYIFEGQGSEIITIPRLPISVDTDEIKPYTLTLALLDAGAELSKEETKGIPEALLGDMDDYKVLSTWGQLIWNQAKNQLLSQALLDFPKLIYQDTFRSDYKSIKVAKERVKLQETLAQVSGLLNTSNGNSSILKQHPGLQYDKYTNKNGIDHFRVTQGLRVSCISSNGELTLRRYGKEPVVNKNP